MGRNAYVIGVFGLTVLLTGAAIAQETISDTLKTLSVFDCTADDERAVYVFQSDENGRVRLINDLATPVQAKDGGFLVTTDTGARKITGDGYFLYRDDETIKGACVSVTDTARATYPAITAGMLPETNTEAADAADMATMLTIKDLQASLVQAEAAKIDLTQRLAAEQASVASLLAKVAGLHEDLDQKHAELLEQTAIADTLQQQLTATQQDLVATRQDLTAVQQTLEVTEQARRAAGASVAALTQKAINLEQDLTDARIETEAMGNLADTAISRIATLQIRAADAVRQELCALISGVRPENCE